MLTRACPPGTLWRTAFCTRLAASCASSVGVADGLRGLEPLLERHPATLGLVAVSATASAAIAARSTGSEAAVTALASASRSSASVRPIARAFVSFRRCQQLRVVLLVRGRLRDVDQCRGDRQRGAQLVRGVGGEALLAAEVVVEAAEHVVEAVGELP